MATPSRYAAALRGDAVHSPLSTNSAEEATTRDSPQTPTGSSPQTSEGDAREGSGRNEGNGGFSGGGGPRRYLSRHTSGGSGSSFRSAAASYEPSDTWDESDSLLQSVQTGGTFDSETSRLHISDDSPEGSDVSLRNIQDPLHDPNASHMSFRLRWPWQGRRGARDTKADRVLQDDENLAAGPVPAKKDPDVAFESLDYEIIESRQHNEEDADLSDGFFLVHTFMRWVVVFVVGVMTGVVAFAIDMGVRLMATTKFTWTKDLIESTNSYVIPVLAWGAMNGFLVLIASLMVCYVEPMAGGSGIPEIKSYLNGVKIQRIVRMKTLFAKAIGVMFSVGGGLAVGKEGPMIHSGAILGAGVSQGQMANACLRLDSRKLVYFRNDHEKRDFVSAGAAAGVAAAFGAPIGGVLFSLEEGASHWNQVRILS
jgi:Voltage gated chloride channel